MSEQPTARPPGKKLALGLTRNQWIIVGVAFAGALGYILWKRHTASSAAATSTAATTPASSNGMSAGTLTSLQDELDSLLGGGAGGGSAGGGGTLGTGGSSAATTPAAVASPASSAATTPAAGGGGTATAMKAGPISNLQATTTKTTIKARWNPAANATQGYQLIITDLSNNEVVQRPKTMGTSITISGLKSGTDYNVGIQGLPGGPGDNIHAKTT